MFSQAAVALEAWLAARQGVAMLDTMALTSHRSIKRLRRYYRPAELAANPAARL